MGVPQQDQEQQDNGTARQSSAPPAHSGGDTAVAVESGQDRPAVNGVTVHSGGQSPVGQPPSPPPPPVPAADGHAEGSGQQLDNSGNVDSPFYPGTTGSEVEEDRTKIPGASVGSEGEIERRKSEEEESEKVGSEEEGHVQLPELTSAKRTPGPQQPGGGSVVFGGGGSHSGGVSVTVLTLDGAGRNHPRSLSRIHKEQSTMSMTPRGSCMESWDRDSLTDLKLVRDFQIRRKYGRRSSHILPSPSRDKFVDLGLSGTRYFNNEANNGNTNGITPTALDSPKTRKSLLEEKFGRLQHQNNVGGDGGSVPVSPLVGRVEEEASPAPGSFPPLSSGTLRTGMKSENSFYVAGRHSNGQSPSLLVSHFGFTSIRPDTFSGIQNHRRVKLDSDCNNDLLRELEHNAQRQILACQNMGYTHRGSRAAQSVLSLKDTVSPSAFHPSSFFSRHPPRGAEGRSSRTGTPGDAFSGDEGSRRKRLTHPSPGGKLSSSGITGGGGAGGNGVAKLLVHDRQDRAAARRATLPTVCGSSLQIMLAQSNGNEKLM